MSFARMEMFFLIWVIPALAVIYAYGRHRRRKILAVFASRQGRTHIFPEGLERRRNWRAVLVLTAGTLLVIAVAGPRYGFQWQEIERKGVDIVIALDCSRSMLAADIQPTRLDRAKREIYDLLTMLQGDRVGLVAFSGSAFLQCPLTIDYTAFFLFLDVLNPDYLPLGGSDLAAAVTTAQEAFDPQSKADKAIILITDGENTGNSDPLKAVAAAHATGIKLYCIGIGSNEGVPIPAREGGFKKDTRGRIVLSRLDEPLLTRMATGAGGAYVRSVAGDMDLEAIYRDQIRAQMDATTVERHRKRLWADRYQWPLVLAVLLMIGSRWIPLKTAGTTALFLVAAALLTTAPPTWAGPRQEGYKAYQADKFDDALDHFTQAQVQDPNDPAVLYNLGNTMYKRQDYDGAATHYRQALPHASASLKPRLLYNLGNTAYRQGELQTAIESYASALKLAPDDRQAKENLAFVKRRLEQQQQGQQPPQQDKSQQDANNPQPQNPTGGQDAHQQGQSQPQQRDGRQQPTEQPPSGETSDMQNRSPQKPADQQAQATEPRSVNPKDRAQQPGRPPEAQMLNRLKDEPGRAMMPHYQKKTVDKDW